MKNFGAMLEALAVMGGTLPSPGVEVGEINGGDILALKGRKGGSKTRISYAKLVQP